VGGSPPADLVVEAARGPADERELLEVARDAARVPAPLLLERFAGGAERALAAKTSPTDMVSEADLASERAIRAFLADRRPDDGVLGEEGETVRGSTGLRWVVDPLDGTIDFLFGIPQWCVSVAVEDDEGTVAGVVFDPCRDETFAATRGGEALLNGVAIQGSSKSDLSDALVATGFAYDADVRRRQAEVLVEVLPRVRDIRRAGSAALDLAWTAMGRHDAYFERTTKPWDVMAGGLICESAGLLFQELPARDGLPAGVIAAPGPLMPALFALVS
jgi:myo-inositol-1(or 4)-monophosphatase